jgi:hypothetical protein
MVYSIEGLLNGFPNGLTFRQLKSIIKDAGFSITNSELATQLKVTKNIKKTGNVYRIINEQDQNNIKLNTAVRELINSLQNFLLASKECVPVPKQPYHESSSDSEDISEPETDSDVEKEEKMSRKFWQKKKHISQVSERDVKTYSKKY